MKKEYVIQPRGEWIVVQKDNTEIKSGGIFIPSPTDKRQNICGRYRVVARPRIKAERIEDIVIGDKVLCRPDDLTLYSSMDGNEYYIVEEQFILSFVNE